MPTRIPLPGLPGDALLKGLESGSGMFARLMQSKLQQQQLQQAQQQHMQNYALRQEKNQREAESFPLLQQKTQAEMEKYQADAAQKQMQQQFFQNLMQGVNQGNTGPMNPMQSINMEDPLQRALFNKMSGLNVGVPTETPSQKSQRAFEDFKRKEQFRGEKALDIPSSQTINDLQRVVDSSNALIPVLEQLEEITSPISIGGFTLSPNLKANVDDLITTSLDNMLGAYKLRSTDKNIDQMLHKLERRPGETNKNWHARIKRTKEEVIERQKSADKSLKNKKVEISYTGNNRKPVEEMTLEEVNAELAGEY